MKYSLSFIVSILTINHSIAQNHNILGYIDAKPAIGTESFNNWTNINGSSEISRDGRYVVYRLNSVNPLYDENTKAKSKLVLQSTATTWKREIPGSEIVDDGKFTDNSKWFLFKNNKDSVAIVSLGSNIIRYLEDVQSYELVGGLNKSLLCYSVKKEPEKLIILDLVSGKEVVFLSVAKYMFCGNLQKVLIKTKKELKSGTGKLVLYNLITATSRTIYEGTSDAENITLDAMGENIAFCTLSNQKVNDKKIWWFSSKNTQAVAIDNSSLLGKDSSIQINYSSRFSFSGDCSKLFVQMLKREKDSSRISSASGINLKIWSYSDIIIPSEQVQNTTKPTYSGYIDLQRKDLIQVTNEYEKIIAKTNRYLFVRKPKNAAKDSLSESWLKYSKEVYEIFDMVSRSWRRLNDSLNYSQIIHQTLSPNGQFIIGYDPIEDRRISYELATGTYRDISHGLIVKCHGRFIDQELTCEFTPEKWATDGRTFFATDDNDIWKFDASGINEPTCVTKRFGNKNNLTFYFIDKSSDLIVMDNGKFVAFAFDNSTKQNGFYLVDQKGADNPVKLSMGKYLYQLKNQTVRSYGYDVKKAASVHGYLVKRMSSQVSPNYFYTKNFKDFKQLSNVCPEKKYNWLTSELHNWKSLSNRSLQGILYKPDNFNPKKKYPVIIHYYERVSDALHVYQTPDPGMGDISISYFVSQGYLVFYADIVLDKSGGGINAYQAIQSAYNYLSQFSFVDKTKVGLQGNSQGGIHTNYIVTHSTSFAAACTSAGYVDLIAIGGRLRDIFSGPTFHRYFADRETGTGQLLWENKEKYIKLSPIFELDKISCPILMEYGTKDSRFYIDGIEFFTGMKLLGKKAWLLEYTDVGHGPFGKEAIDYTVRMFQFFNHYLRGANAPNWMVESLPVEKQNINHSLKLDSLGRIP